MSASKNAIRNSSARDGKRTIHDQSAFFDGLKRDAVNREAAMVFARGTKYLPIGKIACEHWESPPPLRSIPHDTPNIKGVVFGRMTVVGLHQEITGSWVVRCSCGNYEMRKAKAIKNPKNAGDRCTRCRQTAFEKRHHEFSVNGKIIDLL